LLQFIVTEVPS